MLVLQNSTGNVGIGDTTPARTLEVQGNGIRISDGASVGAVINISGSNLNLDWLSNINRNINLLNTGAEGISVGIGTTIPLSTLHVNGSGANAGFRVSNATDTTFFVNASSGNVGIGTTSPQNKLHILGGVSNASSSILNPSDNYNRLILENNNHLRINFVTPNNKHQVIAFSDNDTFKIG